VLNQLVSGPDGVRAAGAGRGDAHIRPLDTQGDGDLGGGHIGNHHRSQEGTDAVRPLLQEHFGLFIEGGQPSNTAADDNADAVLVLRRHLEA